jgi:hypothetical protein
LRVWGSPAEAKVFNPNGYHFYCPDKYTKFVEMRHAVFLEDELMRGSMVA